MVDRHERHDYNIDIRDRRADPKTIGATLIVIFLICAGLGLAVPALIIGAIFTLIYLFARRRVPVSPPPPTPQPAPIDTHAPPFPDVLSGVCQHCGCQASVHVAPDGRLLDVRMFHGLPPRG